MTRSDERKMREKLCQITLKQQRLTQLRPFGKGLQAAQKALEHLGYLQIDTLAVVERAHHHTLWTRIPDYQPEHLYRLVEQRRIFEYWSHAAAYLPMQDYRYALRMMRAIKRGEKSHYAVAKPEYMQRVLERIRNEGALKAGDFDNKTPRKSSWWDWKPAKQALEHLFMQGDLMISRRDGMQKVYDLTERVLPRTVNTREPSPDEFAVYLLNQFLKAYGFTTLRQLMHLRSDTLLRNALVQEVRRRTADRELAEYRIEGMPPLYIAPALLDCAPGRGSYKVRILSPFDNAIIHRDRIRQLFGFEYALECYLPRQKRRYGYFCLPILYRQAFVGRMDCKAHRRDGRFEIISLSLQPRGLDLERFVPEFKTSVSNFARFNQCTQISLTRCSPESLAKKITSAID